MQEKCFAVIGEDGRQRAAAAYLEKLGYRVVGAEQLAAADVIVLPMPLADDRAALAALLRSAKPGVVAYAGKVGAEAAQLARQAKVELFDYLEREELATLNAIPTCEGALEILLRERQETLWGSRALIAGFGRIGKLLALRLTAFGAAVTVAARSPRDRALAAALGCRAQTLAELPATAHGFDLLINTVPAPVIGRDAIAALRENAFLLDLASAPGGIDLAAAGAAQIRAVWALSLPARHAPVTAGRFVAQTVLEMMEERETR